MAKAGPGQQGGIRYGMRVPQVFSVRIEYCYTPNMHRALYQLSCFSRLMFVNAHVICILLDVKEQKADI